MSIYALPVTADDLLGLQESIQFFTNQAQATSTAAAINADANTVFDYAQTLLNANLSLSQVAMACPSLILNETATLLVLDNVSTNFLPGQVAFAVSLGLEPTVYAAEAWAVNVASGNAADFSALYGGLAQAQFAAVVSSVTGINTTAINGWIDNWEAFFSANPSAIPANLNVLTASYAAAFGDALGSALIFGTGGVGDLVENALLTIATDQYVEGVAINTLPEHTALQGEQDLRLTIGVDILTTSAPGAIFDATPAANPPLGSDNTLNTGDTLTDTAGDGIINFTTAGGLGQFVSNPPFALGVNMDGIATANILHSFPLLVPAGFAGVIEGLTNVHLLAGNIGDVQLGLPTQGLLSAVENITIDSVGPIVSLLPDLELWMDDSAFDGTQEVNLVLNGVGALDEAEVDLEVVGGTVGYGAVNVVSNVSLNVLDLDTDSMDTIATVTAEGAADLTIFGSVLDQDTLELFDGSAMTGDIDATFASGTGGVAALGGDGDDTFTWETDGGDPTTFTTADSVDGGGGDNTLRLQADTGVLLAAGVGALITNIQVIEHFDVPGGTTGDLSVNMAESGSATVLDLAGEYDFGGPHNVFVTNLLNADTVVYSGFDLGTPGGAGLHLTPTSPIGIINLQMNGTNDPSAVHVLGDLEVNNGSLFNIESTGPATENVIATADDIDPDNVSITGDVDLTLGSEAFFYDNDGGTIDASAFGADLHVFVGDDLTVIGSAGDDLIEIMDQDANQPDLIDLTFGGSDTVEFHDTNGDDGDAVNPGNYTNITGFDLADDVVAIDVDVGTNVNLFSTNGTALVGGEPLSIYPMQTNGPDDNLAGVNLNFIQITTDQTSIGFNLQQIFNFAMGTTDLTVNPAVDLGGGEILMAFHDVNAPNGGQIVLFTVDPGVDNIISAGDDVDMVTLIADQTYADYLAFGANNLQFVA